MAKCGKKPNCPSTALGHHDQGSKEYDAIDDKDPADPGYQRHWAGSFGPDHAGHRPKAEYKVERDGRDKPTGEAVRKQVFQNTILPQTAAIINVASMGNIQANVGFAFQAPTLMRRTRANSKDRIVLSGNRNAPTNSLQVGLCQGRAWVDDALHRCLWSLTVSLAFAITYVTRLYSQAGVVGGGKAIRSYNASSLRTRDVPYNVLAAGRRPHAPVARAAAGWACSHKLAIPAPTGFSRTVRRSARLSPRALAMREHRAQDRQAAIHGGQPSRRRAHGATCALRGCPHLGGRHAVGSLHTARIYRRSPNLAPFGRDLVQRYQHGRLRAVNEIAAIPRSEWRLCGSSRCRADTVGSGIAARRSGSPTTEAERTIDRRYRTSA